MSFLYNSDTDYMSITADWTPSAVTILVWFYPLATQEHIFVRCLTAGDALLMLGMYYLDTDDLTMEVGRATTNSVRWTSGAGITADSHHFVVGTYSNSSGIKMYKGGLSSLAVECSYGGADAGSGNANALSTAMYIGNRDTDDSRRINGDLSMVHIIDRELTLGEIRDQQFRPHIVEGSRFFILPGLHGASACPDLSGNGYSVTINGLTVGSNPTPLPAPFAVDAVLPYRTVGGYWTYFRVYQES